MREKCDFAVGIGDYITAIFNCDKGFQNISKN